MKIEIQKEIIRNLEYFRRFVEHNVDNTTAKLILYQMSTNLVNEILKKAEEIDPEIYIHLPEL